MDRRPLGPKEINGLFMPPGNADRSLTDFMITGKPLKQSELTQESG